jgi:hypothetical protein
MKQLKVGLPDALRSRLGTAAAASGKGLAEEIRGRLERTFENEIERGDAPTLKLSEAIEKLATLVSIQTGHAWHAHPAANRVMRFAITGRLARLTPQGDAVFAPSELPTARLVAPGSDDPEAMGLALETLEFHTPPMTPELADKINHMIAAERAKLARETKKSTPTKGKRR